MGSDGGEKRDNPPLIPICKPGVMLVLPKLRSSLTEVLGRKFGGVCAMAEEARRAIVVAVMVVKRYCIV